MFAANDAAFQKYFTNNNTSLDKIDVATTQKLALYGLVYNLFRKDQLAFNQTSLGLIPDVAYRRQTVYYDFVYTDLVGEESPNYAGADIFGKNNPVVAAAIISEKLKLINIELKNEVNPAEVRALLNPQRLLYKYGF